MHVNMNAAGVFMRLRIHAFLLRIHAFLSPLQKRMITPWTPVQVLWTRKSLQALPIKVLRLPTFPPRATQIKMNIQTRPILIIMVTVMMVTVTRNRKAGPIKKADSTQWPATFQN
jgi:hypothetical protein